MMRACPPVSVGLSMLGELGEWSRVVLQMCLASLVVSLVERHRAELAPGSLTIVLGLNEPLLGVLLAGACQVKLLWAAL